MLRLPFFKTDNLVGLKMSDFPKDLVWFNLPSGRQALNLSELRGNVLLVDFWTYSCVNCLRTLPYLKHWDEKYKDLGLVIIGVHTPEFGFEKDPQNVGHFLEKTRLKYPVVLDNDYKIWNAFANHYWPRKLLIDSYGVIRYDHSGEGDYSQTEKEIQRLLQEENRDLKFGRVVPEIEHVGLSSVCYPTNPESYCGFKRGVFGNLEGIFPNRVFEYRYRGAYEDGKIYLEGHWVVRPESLKHADNTSRHKDFLALRFHGLELNAVMVSEENQAEEVVVTLDDQRVSLDFRGTDLRNQEDRSLIVVKEPRMYNLIKTKTYGSRVLKLSPKSDKFEIFAFTFGGCIH